MKVDGIEFTKQDEKDCKKITRGIDEGHAGKQRKCEANSSCKFIIGLLVSCVCDNGAIRYW